MPRLGFRAGRSEIDAGYVTARGSRAQLPAIKSHTRPKAAERPTPAAGRTPRSMRAGSAASSVGGPTTWQATEEELLARGMLPAVDFCRFALQLSGGGRVPDADHILSCPICLRRWR